MESIGGDSEAGTGRQAVEEVAVALVREFLSRKGCRKTAKVLEEEIPRNSKSISNRSDLAHVLHISPLLRRNKALETPFRAIIEMISWDLLMNHKNRRESSRSKRPSTTKDKLNAEEARSDPEVSDSATKAKHIKAGAVGSHTEENERSDAEERKRRKSNDVRKRSAERRRDDADERRRRSSADERRRDSTKGRRRRDSADERKRRTRRDSADERRRDSTKERSRRDSADERKRREPTEERTRRDSADERRDSSKERTRRDSADERRRDSTKERSRRDSADERKRREPTEERTRRDSADERRDSSKERTRRDSADERKKGEPTEERTRRDSADERKIKESTAERIRRDSADERRESTEARRGSIERKKRDSADERGRDSADERGRDSAEERKRRYSTKEELGGRDSSNERKRNDSADERRNSIRDRKRTDSAKQRERRDSTEERKKRGLTEERRELDEEKKQRDSSRERKRREKVEAIKKQEIVIENIDNYDEAAASKCFKWLAASPSDPPRSSDSSTTADKNEAVATRGRISKPKFKTSSKQPGLPLGFETATKLRGILFGNSRVSSFTDEWIAQSFSFRECEDLVTNRLRFGIIQKHGGPSGLLAVVQAYFLKHLLFGKVGNDGSEIHNAEPSVLNASTGIRSSCLAETIIEILWRAGGEQHAVVTFLSNEQSFTPMRGYKEDGITEFILTNACNTLEDLHDIVYENINRFENGDGAAVLLLYSAILSRGLDEVAGDMDDPMNILMGAHSHCTQEMVNLLAVGMAVSNTFDDQITLNQGMVLRGVTRRAHIGMLSLFEHFSSCNVGNNLKTPRFPIWIICNENHFSVVFCLNRDLVDDEASKPIFDLFYYDGLSNLQKEIKLTIDTTKESPTQSSEDVVSPLEHCIRTKWPQCVINWNGLNPLL